MSGSQPDHAVRVPLCLQRWESITFVHWRYDAATLKPHVPEGLRLQLIDGSAWLAVTPFTLGDLRVPGVPAIPRWSTFPELNLRTYVTDGKHDGVLFLRVHCGRRVVAAALRAGLGLPYAFRSPEAGAGQSSGARAGTFRLAGTRAHVLVGDPVLPSPLVGSLTGRWNAYTRHLGRTWRIPIEHPPWPLHEAALTDLATDLFTACALPRPTGTPMVHYSPGVDVRIGAPRPVTRRPR